MAARTKEGFTVFDTIKSIGAFALIALTGGLRRALAEPHHVQQTDVTIPVRQLPPAWERTRVTFLADLHIRPHEGLGGLAQLVARANAIRSDLIVLGGDVFAGSTRDPMAAVDILSDLGAPLGVFAVLGNHDRRVGQGVHEALTAAGIDVFVNERRRLVRDGQALDLAGLDDLRRGVFAPAEALPAADSPTPTIVIAHNPDTADHIPPGVRIDAMLSGHTHGGQIRLWGLGPVALPVRNRRYGAGLVEGPGFPVYISRGLGTAALPVRFHCPPELTVITLTVAPGG